MDRLKLRTKKMTKQLVVQRDLVNVYLEKITNAFKQNNRLREIVFDCETEIMLLEQSIEKLTDTVGELSACENSITKRLAFVREQYEHSIVDEQEAFREVLFELLADYEQVVFDLSDSKKMLDTKLKQKAEFEKQRHKYQVQIGSNEMAIQRTMKKLRTSVEHLENLLGYSIGSHMLDWCYDSTGKVTSLPQLLPIEIEETQPEERLEEDSAVAE